MPFHKPFHKSAAALAFLAAALAAGADTQSAARARTPKIFEAGGGRVDVMSDGPAEYDFRDGWAVFTSNVAVRYQGSELRADSVRFNQKTGMAHAEGGVVMAGDDGSLWHARTLVADTKTQAAAARDIDMHSAPFRILASEGSAAAPGADGADAQVRTYEIKDAILTTCTNEPGHFHYQLAARRLRLRPGQDFTAWGATPSLFGMPFFWLPYYWRDLSRNYGFRFEPGYQSSWGPYLLSSYQIPIYWDKATGTYFDSKTSVDYRYKRGFAFGERLRWGRAEESEGLFSAYWLDDEDIPFGVEDARRYRLRLNQSWSVTPSDKLLIQGLYVSDDRFMEDFFESEHREMGQPDSYASYTHYADDYSFGLLARMRLNDFYTQVERLPEAWFNLNPVELYGSGVYLENASSAGFLRRRFDERYSPLPEDYSAFRFDALTRLSAPFKAGFLNIVPRAGYRATYYSQTLERLVSSRSENVVSTNEYGDVETFTRITSSAETSKAGAGLRSIFEAGAEISFKAYGFWQDASGAVWRHVVEPYADYSYVPEPNLTPERLHQFDAVDELGRNHSVRLGVRNRWQVKPQGARSAAYERVYNNVYTDVNLDPAQGEKSVSSFYTETRFRPAPWLRADLDTRYSFDASALDSASARLLAWHGVFNADFEYRYRADDSSLFMSSITWHMNSAWSANGFGRYEFETSRMEEIGAWVEKRLDCIAFRVYASVLPGYTTSAGRDEQTDYKVSFLVWLTDFVPESIRERDSR